MIALSGTSCAGSRSASRVREFESARAQDSRDSVRVEQVMVAVHDTIVEKVTIVVRQNEAGDTLRLDRVTERERISEKAVSAAASERVVIQHDTVFIAAWDSTDVSDLGFGLQSSGSLDEIIGRAERMGYGKIRGWAVISALKWIFWILVCVIVLVIVFKVRKFLNLFE